eukprot:SAG11_NODE_7630_length_1112_cov_0.967647_1_plen_188_part_00
MQRSIKAALGGVSREVEAAVKAAIATATAPAPRPPPPPPKVSTPAPPPAILSATPATLPPGVSSESEAFALLAAEHRREQAELAAHFGRPAPPSAAEAPAPSQYRPAVPGVQRQLQFIDAARPLRQSPLGFNQQLSTGGTEASKVAVVVNDPGYVPCNDSYRVGKRPPLFAPGTVSSARKFSHTILP